MNQPDTRGYGWAYLIKILLEEIASSSSCSMFSIFLVTALLDIIWLVSENLLVDSQYKETREIKNCSTISCYKSVCKRWLSLTIEYIYL